MLCWALATCQLFGQSIQIASFPRDAAGGPSPAVAMGGKLYFSAYDPVHGRELWATDGTSAGTHLVKDIKPGIGSGVSDIFNLVALAVGDMLYFRADDGASGNELWKTDGTEAGTVQVKDIQNGFYGSNPGAFAQVNGMLFFTAYSGSELWRSNGTASGTQLVRTFTVATNLYGHMGTLYFSGDVDNTGQELWKSNGTFNTTERVRDLNGMIGASLPINFHAAGDVLYFDASTDTGWELWRTDGTQTGTVLVKDINPGSGNGTLNAYANVAKTNLGDTLYFRATDGVNGFQLWRTTGTDASTVRVSDLPDGVDAACLFPIVGGKVLMNNYAATRWWAFDPVTDNVELTAYPSGYYFNWQGKCAFLGSTMFYAGKDTAFGCELWRADGLDGDEHRTQETHFTDNWQATADQPFTTLLGQVNGKVLFTQARSAYNTDVPLFSHTPNSTACRPPLAAMGIPVKGSGLHVVFDRTADYGARQIRYRQPGASQWETTATNTGYAELDVDADQAWEFDVQVDCEGTWSDWSPLFTYDPEQIPAGLYLEGSILADRAENATTERIYWSRSSAQVAMQLRYKPFGAPSDPWTMAADTTGMRRLTGLQPETLYTYDHRFFDGVNWSPWSYAPLYFSTSTPEITTGLGQRTGAALSIAPNPAAEAITLAGLAATGQAVWIVDGLGRKVWESSLHELAVDIRQLQRGAYLLVVMDGETARTARFMKQ